MDLLETVRLVLRYLHLIGFALLFGGFCVQYMARQMRINSAMLWGAVLQLVTGIGLAAPLRGAGEEPAPAKLIVKLVLALVITAMVVAVRKRETIARGHFIAIGAVTLVTAAVAVFWR